MINREQEEALQLDDVFSLEGTALSPASFNRFADFITAELGIKMPEGKLTMVQSRILRRVRELRLQSVEEYGDYFFSSAHEDEREQFINVITTNKTDFFREPEHFQYLVQRALPSLLPNNGFPTRVNVWSAGCSTGEEPYTLGMILSEFAKDHYGFDFSILGTDISTRVLSHAQKGIYQEPQIEPVPLDYRKKYLMRSRNPDSRQVRIVPQLRQRVSFHQLNFMDADYPIEDEFDIIFFRNVLIYFEKETQEEVINKMCRHLSPGGFLFVGHSESLATLDIPVVSVATSIFQKPTSEHNT